MSLFVKTESNFEKATPGMVDAICIAVADIGTQMTRFNEVEKPQHQVMICWKIAQLMQEGERAGENFIMCKRYHYTLDARSTLSKDMESWFARKISDEVRNAGFDLETLVGKKCTLNLMESQNGSYTNINSVLPAMGSNVMAVSDTELPPKAIAKAIERSVEHQAKAANDFGQSDPFADTTDDMPF